MGGYAHRHLETMILRGGGAAYRAGRQKAWSAEEQTLVSSRHALRRATDRTRRYGRVRRTIRQLARHSGVRVLILGESGTGKEAAALMLHHLSDRRE